MQRIRIHRPRVPRERGWHEVLPPDPRDPDVVRAGEPARSKPIMLAALPLAAFR